LPQCATVDDCPAQNPCLIGTCTSKGTCAFSPKAEEVGKLYLTIWYGASRFFAQKSPTSGLWPE
jgi:hypothetical protein